MSEEIQRMIKRLEGDGPVEKHILLLKLKEALDHAPQFGDKPIFEINTPQRQWLAGKYGIELHQLHRLPNS